MQKTKTSIVIASFSSVQHLEKCLASIKTYAANTEIIVSTIFTAEQIKPLQQNNIRFVFNPDEQNLSSVQLRETRVFRLRSQGVSAAQGERILLIEDHCEVTPKWLESMQVTLSNSNCIAGGPVKNGSNSSLFCWALYWSEYSAMMPPFPAESMPYLSAVNCGYFKTALDACNNVWQDGFYDNEVHDALITQGAKYCPATNAIVLTSLPFSFNQALVHLYTGGKRYGSYRGGHQWNSQRLIRVLSTFAVPAVLLVRIFKLIRQRQPQHTVTFLMAWPVLYILLGAWGLGELVGTLRGFNKKMTH
ncbi:hypothetical protein MNBD_GAMMA23-349 [hydrothermal vent metagenome]|uniref:Glycosyltransferase 2-like domain-containing protein n=1 Tax=hydrothermal vent metagenome TaxID=652676 RepID=A0A3B1A3N2_9ZZZZ